MIWNRHSAFEGQHARLSASKPSWLGYDDDKFDRVFVMQQAAKRGTELHALAAEMIRLKVQARGSGTTFADYVNHGIGYRMRPEHMLMHSVFAFGTPDTIGFRKGLLRIHDLKTGMAMTSFKQLECYAALFCLEYFENPFKIKMETRIYQNDEIRVHFPDADDIMHIMERYKDRVKRIDQLLAEEDE